MSLFRKSSQLPDPGQALPGRATRLQIAARHAVLCTAQQGPFAAPLQQVLFGMGCFWGAERLFWRLPGVHSTTVGYAGGFTLNPSYQEVCSGQTGHAEVVSVVFDPGKIGFDRLLATFWESHDPTQGMRQGNDVGTQYRSVIYTTTNEQLTQALASRDLYQSALRAAHRGAITTEIAAAPDYYLAEDYHQQYLHKNPDGYCGIGGCGVRFVPDVR
jgi:peptide-methionine (S)-S-oxide reductase